MLERVVAVTNEYIEKMPKSERKGYGQFFTSMETARFMAGMYDLSNVNGRISVLDAGAGSGILSCALLQRLNGVEQVDEINLVCYETDEKILPILQENLEHCQKSSHKRFHFEVRTENYILAQGADFSNLIGGANNLQKYDLVIGNPPYMKIGRNAPEALAMPSVCYGAPNLYFLFAAMGMFNLKEQGEMVYIIPRSWTSGAYFKRFREYILKEGKLCHIHLFSSRNKVFSQEQVLQETMIVKFRKTNAQPEQVRITSSESNGDFDDIDAMDVPYSLVVAGDDLYVYLIKDKEELAVLQRLQGFRKTLPQIGLKMKTGLTVDFRNRELLRNTEEKGTVPLFYAQHLRNGQVDFPIHKENEYVLTDKAGLVQENKNYLFVKRFSAKEEPRRLQCSVYLARKFPQYNKISTQNKLNFVDAVAGEMSECLLYGLYVIFNSTVYDKYYRILNGSTQVNSTEINAMPVPELAEIQDMGRKLLKSQDYSEANCDTILEGYCG